MTPVWRLTAGQRLAHRGWDEEYVLYNDLSGDTHLVGAAALYLLLRLRAADADAATLLAALEAEFDTDAGADLGADIATMLDQLCAYSLIEPRP